MAFDESKNAGRLLLLLQWTSLPFARGEFTRPFMVLFTGLKVSSEGGEETRGARMWSRGYVGKKDHEYTGTTSRNQ